MSETLLQKLYFGKIAPWEKPVHLFSTYRQQQESAQHAYSLLREKLPPELRQEYETVIDQQFTSLSGNYEESFLDGFVLGMQLMIEVYQHHSPQP